MKCYSEPWCTIRDHVFKWFQMPLLRPLQNHTLYIPPSCLEISYRLASESFHLSRHYFCRNFPNTFQASLALHVAHLPIIIPRYLYVLFAMRHSNGVLEVLSWWHKLIRSSISIICLNWCRLIARISAYRGQCRWILSAFTQTNVTLR